MTEKLNLKSKELILILYLTISTGIGILIITVIIWMYIALRHEPDPNPNLGVLYLLLFIPQILGIFTGIIICMLHFFKNTDYKIQTLIPLTIWILSVLMYFLPLIANQIE